MFVNSNYSAKLSPTMKENWLVQIFKNTNSSILTGDTPDLRFCFATDSGSTTTTFNSKDYLPTILNKPSVNYSLDLKKFTTKTGSITLNIANVNIDGTQLLELLGDSYLNGQVNILSTIDDDSSKANALQIFSGKVSSFAYKNNIIILNILTSRPFQEVQIPNTQSTGTIKRFKPVVYGEFTANPSTSFSASNDVFPCPFLKNDGSKLYYMLPEATTTGTDKLEFYDSQMQRFMVCTNSENAAHGSATQKDGSRVLGVPKEMIRTFKILPDDIDGGIVEQEGSGSGSIAVTYPNGDGTINNVFDGDTGSEADINHSGNFTDIRGFTMKLVMPQVSGKITAVTLGLDGTITQAYSSGSPGNDSGLFVNLATSLDSGSYGAFGNTSGDVEIIGTNSVYIRTTSIDLTASYSAVNIVGILEESSVFPDDLYLSFRWDTAEGDVDCDNWNVSLENIYVTITAQNDVANEPIATQNFNAGINKLYLGRDSYAKNYTASSSANDSTSVVDNPVSIHRELLKTYMGMDFANATQVANSGYDTLINLRDDTATEEWNAKLMLLEQKGLEKVLKDLQFEGCFFFEISPQAQQTTDVAGTYPFRYFTIANSPSANVNLSEVDISDYSLGITTVQDLETSFKVNYNNHVGENEYLETASFVSATSGSVHGTIFSSLVGVQENTQQQKQFELKHLYKAVDGVGSARNDDWVNFRSSLFGKYRTTMSATIVNPEKYGMLQVGDFLDFGDTLFGNLGTPFSEISDTFDSMIAMPTRLFSEEWTDKKFIITNLKRQIGRVNVQCREVS